MNFSSGIGNLAALDLIFLHATAASTITRQCRKQWNPRLSRSAKGFPFTGKVDALDSLAALGVVHSAHLPKASRTAAFTIR